MSCPHGYNWCGRDESLGGNEFTPTRHLNERAWIGHNSNGSNASNSGITFSGITIDLRPDESVWNFCPECSSDFEVVLKQFVIREDPY